MRLSVVIPAYKCEATIARALDSVFLQGVDDLEVVVVDDGSPDRLAEVVSAYPDARVRLVRHDRNRGEAAARNTGIREARGTYIAWLDADDEWLPGKLTIQLAAMDAAPAEIAGIFTGYDIVDLEGTRRRAETAFLTASRPIGAEELFVHGCDISPGITLMVRREICLDAGNYDEALPLYVDWDWLIRLTRQWKLISLPQSLAVYYQSPRRPGSLLKVAAKLFLAKHKEFLQTLPNRARRHGLARIHLDLAGGYSIERRRLAALKHYLWSLMLQPLHPPGQYVQILDNVAGTRLVPVLRKFVSPADAV